MKKVILFNCFLFLSCLLHAQAAGIGLYVNLNFYPSTGINRMLIGKDGSSYDRFVASYNQLNASSLASPLTTLRMKISPNIGMNAILGKFYTELGYRSIRGSSEGVFKNGNKRVIDVLCNDLDIGIGLGKSGEKFYGFIAGFMNFGFGDKLESYTVYPNGFKSYGSENFLNGRYTSTRITFRTGLRFGYKVKNNLWITLWLDRVKEGKKSEYIDNLAGDIDTEVTGTDNQFIGEDWGSYLADEPSYILDDKPLLQSGWNGLQVQLGVNLILGGNE